MIDVKDAVINSVLFLFASFTIGGSIYSYNKPTEKISTHDSIILESEMSDKLYQSHWFQKKKQFMEMESSRYDAHYAVIKYKELYYLGDHYNVLLSDDVIYIVIHGGSRGNLFIGNEKIFYKDFVHHPVLEGLRKKFSKPFRILACYPESRTEHIIEDVNFAPFNAKGVIDYVGSFKPTLDGHYLQVFQYVPNH